MTEESASVTHIDVLTSPGSSSSLTQHTEDDKKQLVSSRPFCPSPRNNFPSYSNEAISARFRVSSLFNSSLFVVNLFFYILIILFSNTQNVNNASVGTFRNILESVSTRQIIRFNADDELRPGDTNFLSSNYEVK